MKTRFDQILHAGLAAIMVGMGATAFGAGFYLPELGSPASLGSVLYTFFNQ